MQIFLCFILKATLRPVYLTYFLAFSFKKLNLQVKNNWLNFKEIIQ